MCQPPTVVEEAFADAITSTEAIQPSLEQALSADAATVEAAYQAIKELQLVHAADSNPYPKPDPGDGAGGQGGAARPVCVT